MVGAVPVVTVVAAVVVEGAVGAAVLVRAARRAVAGAVVGGAARETAGASAEGAVFNAVEVAAVVEVARPLVEARVLRAGGKSASSFGSAFGAMVGGGAGVM